MFHASAKQKMKDILKKASILVLQLFLQQPSLLFFVSSQIYIHSSDFVTVSIL